MIVSVEHSTVYRYDCPVLLEPHTFRLRPRMTTTQRLLAFDLHLAHLAWFNTLASEPCQSQMETHLNMQIESW